VNIHSVSSFGFESFVFFYPQTEVQQTHRTAPQKSKLPQMYKNTIKQSAQMRDALYYLSAPILIVGGLNWLVTGIQNLSKRENATKADDLLNLIGLPASIVNIVYIVVGIAAFGLLAHFAFKTYLQDTGVSAKEESFFPATLTVAERTPDNADAAVKIQVDPFAKVAYWAPLPAIVQGEPYESKNEAYGNYTNAGVAIADAEGAAVLRFRTPNSYKYKGQLMGPHVHYRVARAAKENADGINVDKNRHEAHTWSAVQTVSEFQNFAQ